MTHPLGRAGARLLARFVKSSSLAENSAAAGPASTVLAASQAGRHFSALPEAIEGKLFLCSCGRLQSQQPAAFAQPQRSASCKPLLGAVAYTNPNCCQSLPGLHLHMTCTCASRQAHLFHLLLARLVLPLRQGNCYKHCFQAGGCFKMVVHFDVFGGAQTIVPGSRKLSRDSLCHW